MRRIVLAFALRGGASWSAREDAALLRAVRTYQLDPRDGRATPASLKRHALRWRHVAKALGRTERAVRTRFLVLRLAARLCGCRKKRRRR